MNLFGIGSNGVNKTNSTVSGKQSGAKGEDFLSFLSKATDSDKSVQEKPKTAPAEKETAKDKVEETTKEDTTPKEKVENEQVETETAAPQEEQVSDEENVMAAYLNQMMVNPLLLNKNTVNVEEAAETLVLQANPEQTVATAMVEENSTGNFQQNNNQGNLQNQMLDFLKSNMTEEQQVQRMNLVDTLQTEESEVIIQQENVQKIEGEGEENPLLQNQNMMQMEASEETVLAQPIQTVQNAEGHIQIPISDSSSVIQSQPAMQLADKILVNIQNGVQEFNMTLNPERLGQVAVKMVIENGIVNLHVQVHNAAAHTALAAGLGELRALLESNNLQVAEIEISMYSGEEQQEKEAAQQENRKGQTRYHVDGMPEDELAVEEEVIMVETSELNYSI